MSYLKNVATGAVFGGSYIPAHDETFDLAEEVAGKLEEFRAYVESVRDKDQADDALIELVDAIKSGVYDITRPNFKEAV